MKRFTKFILVLAALTSLPASANSLTDYDHKFGCELYIARSPTSPGAGGSSDGGRIGSDKQLSNWFGELKADCDPQQGSCPDGGNNQLVDLGFFAMSHDNTSLVFDYAKDLKEPEFFQAMPPMTTNNGCVATHQLFGLGSETEMDHNSEYSCYDAGSWSDKVWIKKDGDYLPSRSSVLPWQIASGSKIWVLGRNPGLGNDFKAEDKVNQLVFVGDGCESLASSGAWNTGSKCDLPIYSSKDYCKAVNPDIVAKLKTFYENLLKNSELTPSGTASVGSIGMYSGAASSRPTGSPPVLDSGGSSSNGAQ